MKQCGIYLITHQASGQRYVGQSGDIANRLRCHAGGKSGNGLIGNAIAKHGWEAFEVIVLEHCARESLNAREVVWIETLGTLHPGGYNLTTGGQQYQFDEATRKRISERTRAVMTPEWIANRAASLRGVPKSAEHRAKIGAAQRNPVNIARITEMARNRSAATREKIAAAHRGKVASAETRAKISRAKSTPENIARLAAVVRNFGPETRAKMSASAKARCARQKLQREQAAQ